MVAKSRLSLNETIEKSAESIVRKLEHAVSEENRVREQDPINFSKIDISEQREELKRIFKRILRYSRDRSYADYRMLIKDSEDGFNIEYNKLLKALFIDSNDNQRPNIIIGDSLVIYNLTYVFQLYLSYLDKDFQMQKLNSLKLINITNNINQYIGPIINSNIFDDMARKNIHIFKKRELIVLSFSMHFNTEVLKSFAVPELSDRANEILNNYRKLLKIAVQIEPIIEFLKKHSNQEEIKIFYNMLQFMKMLNGNIIYAKNLESTIKRDMLKTLIESDIPNINQIELQKYGLNNGNVIA